MMIISLGSSVCDDNDDCIVLVVVRKVYIYFTVVVSAHMILSSLLDLSPSSATAS